MTATALIVLNCVIVYTTCATRAVIESEPASLLQGDALTEADSTRFVRKENLRAGVAEFLAVHLASDGTLMRDVNPVIQSQDRCIYVVLWIRQGKPC